jgi:hypothetical protein
MEELKKYLHHQLDNYAKQYYGSPAADELIQIKKRLDEWITKKQKCIHEFYATDKTDIISFKCNHNTFSLRLTFYRNGQSRIIIKHTHKMDEVIRDVDIINEYSVDAGSVYFIESEFGWKIGKAKKIAQRKRDFAVKMPFVHAVRCHIKTHKKSQLERYFHDYFKDKQINGEWFNISLDDIIEAVKTQPHLQLNSYGPDDHIKVKYIPK